MMGHNFLLFASYFSACTFFLFFFFHYGALSDCAKVWAGTAQTSGKPGGGGFFSCRELHA